MEYLRKMLFSFLLFWFFFWFCLQTILIYDVHAYFAYKTHKQFIECLYFLVRSVKHFFPQNSL